MRSPIHSKKHYVQVSLQTVLAGARLNTTLIDAQEITATDPDEVEEGAIVKAIFIEMWARTGDTAAGSVLMSLIKLPGGVGFPTFVQLIALHDYDNKKNILYHTQGNSNDQDSTATAFIRQWFKIPKGKQRFGLGDKLILSVSAQALDQIICGFCTYKEYQ